MDGRQCVAGRTLPGRDEAGAYSSVEGGVSEV